MKNLVVGLAAAGCFLVGCSKEEPPPAEPAADLQPADGADQQAAAPAPAPAPVQLPAGDAMRQDLDSIPLTLQNQDYNTAVNQLGAMGAVQGQMTEAQRQAYQQQLWQTQEYLREQAKRDAGAKEAYERLGKQMMGR